MIVDRNVEQLSSGNELLGKFKSLATDLNEVLDRWKKAGHAYSLGALAALDPLGPSLAPTAWQTARAAWKTRVWTPAGVP